MWMDINIPLPKWIESASKDIFDESDINELNCEREKLVQKAQIDREIKRKNAEKKEREIEEAQKKLMAELFREREVEETEFRLLVEEIKPLQFTHSKQVSSYIMRNRLGDKYKNISGVVKMEMEGNTWNFNGGFPPKIYAKLCEELGLSSQGTRARVVSFDSFKAFI